MGDHRRLTWSRRLRSLPPVLLAIGALWVSLLLGASIVWPVGYGFDEPAHVSMAYTYSVHPFRFYAGGQLHYTDGVEGFVRTQAPVIGPQTTDIHFSVTPIPGRSDRQTLAQLGGAAIDPTSSPDQMVQHPPGYYWLEALVMRVPGVAGLPAGAEIWLMRLLSILIMAPLPFLCWSAARHLIAGASRRQPGPGLPSADDDRVALLAAALPLTIPDLIRDGAAVNNDTLLILSTSVVLAMLARVVCGDFSRRTAAWTAAAVCVALWTKGFALALPPVILLAYLCGRRRVVGAPQPSVLRPLLIVAAGCAVGAVWWVRNLVDYGVVQVNGVGAGYDHVIYGRPVGGGTLGAFLKPFFGGLLWRIWGEIGIPEDRPWPGPLVVWGWAALVGVLLLLALLVPGGYRSRMRCWPFVLALLAVTGIDAAGSFSTFHTYRVVGANQGRYTYPAIAGVVAVAAVGGLRLLPRRAIGWAVTAVVAAAIATNAWCWLLILRTFYQPPGRLPFWRGLIDAVHGVLRWSPLPDALTLAFVFVLPAVCAVAAVVMAAAASPGRPAGEPGPTSPVRPPLPLAI